MPQLNLPDFLPQLVWLAISFALLYLLMARVALPRVGAAIVARAALITAELDRAVALKGEAEAARTAYEKALAEARTRAQGLTRAAEAEAAKAAASRQAVVDAELATRIKAGEERIATAKQAALRNITAVAAETARDATRRLIGVDVSQAEAEAAAAGVR